MSRACHRARRPWAHPPLRVRSATMAHSGAMTEQQTSTPRRTLSTRARWGVPVVVAVGRRGRVRRAAAAGQRRQRRPADDHARAARRAGRRRTTSSRCPAPSSTPPGSGCRRSRSRTSAAPTPVVAARWQLDHARLDRRRRALPRRAAGRRRPSTRWCRTARRPGRTRAPTTRWSTTRSTRPTPPGTTTWPSKAQAGELPVAGDLPTPAEASRQAVTMAKAVLDRHARRADEGRRARRLPARRDPEEPDDPHREDRGRGGRQDRAPRCACRCGAGRTRRRPALELGFTDVTFGDARRLRARFSTPPGASTKDVVVPLPERARTDPDRPGHAARGRDGLRHRVGHRRAGVRRRRGGSAGRRPGRRAVAARERTASSTRRAPSSSTTSSAPDKGSSGSPLGTLDTSALYDQLTQAVPEGRLLTSALLSVLVTDDGRVLVGAVPAETLQALAR